MESRFQIFEFRPQKNITGPPKWISSFLEITQKTTYIVLYVQKYDQTQKSPNEIPRLDCLPRDHDRTM